MPNSKAVLDNMAATQGALDLCSQRFESHPPFTTEHVNKQLELALLGSIANSLALITMILDKDDGQHDTDG